jgi:NAD(P)-dependent dehydrogenase (short-subunit alcohol dehydrogenase family)
MITHQEDPPMAEPLRVLVTGGASGIGLAIASAFESRGDRVHICGTNAAKLADVLESNTSVSGSVCDVTDEGAVTELFAELEETLGGLDVLVNNAGIAGPTARIDDVTLDQWLETMSVNVTGVFLCSRAAAPLLRATAGSIVNISSVAGRLGYAFRSPYCASKFAMAGITESLARELGPDGVRVNSILPGFVDSNRLNSTTAARAAALDISFDEMEGRLLEKTSLRRKVSEDEVAQMALYLTSTAGRNISGQSISVCANVEYL